MKISIEVTMILFSAMIMVSFRKGACGVVYGCSVGLVEKRA